MRGDVDLLAAFVPAEVLGLRGIALGLIAGQLSRTADSVRPAAAPTFSSIAGPTTFGI